jgi:hypothetical protein
MLHGLFCVTSGVHNVAPFAMRESIRRKRDEEARAEDMVFRQNAPLIAKACGLSIALETPA